MQNIARRCAQNLILVLWLLALLPGTAPGQEVKRATLKNGLRVVVVRNEMAPVATVMLNYLAGSNQDPDRYPGMAHALEHMMFRGSPDLSANQLAAVMAALGGRFNAATRQTTTQYFATIPAEEVDVALRVEAIRMQNLLDLREFKELWQKERGAIEQEVAQKLSNPMFLFYRRLLRQIYAGTPYAHTGLGTRDSFRRTTGKLLKEFHQTWYAPNNAILVIVGNVNPETTVRTATHLFENISARQVPSRSKVKLLPLQADTIEMETDLPHGMAIAAYRLPGYAHPDYAAGRVLADVLNSQRGKLFALVPKGEALSAGFSSMPQPPATIGFATASFPKGGKGGKLVDRIQEIIADYRQKGLPAELVEAAKRREIATAELKKNSITGLAMLWSEALAIEKHDSPEEAIEAIKKVTLEDVNRVARKHLRNTTAVTAVLTPLDGKPAAAEGFGGLVTDSFAPQTVEQVSLPTWAEQARVAKIPPPSAEPTDVRLKNGLRLIVLPQNISPTVSLYGQVRNNPFLQAPKGKEGVDRVLAELFTYGTTSLDRLAFQKELDEIAARESAGTNFSLRVLSEHFDRGVQLLGDHLLHPALPKSAFETVQKEIARAVAGELQSPDFHTRQSLKKALFPDDDPTLRHATAETVSSLSLQDVKAYHREVFRPDMTTIVIIGRIKPGQARNAIERHFGSWEATGAKPETDPPPVPSNIAAARRVPDPSRVQDKVILAETVDITRSHPAYYPLQLGRHVLAGAFYATRLYQDLRENTGLVYSVAARLDAGKNRSVFLVYYGSDPENVAKAHSLVVRNLGDMQRRPLAAVELQQARTLLLRQIPLARASVSSLANQWLSLVRQDLPLGEPHLAAERYQQLTAGEVQEAFARYIRPSALVRVIQGPAPQ